jgi:hypothetical protein
VVGSLVRGVFPLGSDPAELKVARCTVENGRANLFQVRGLVS